MPLKWEKYCNDEKCFQNVANPLNEKKCLWNKTSRNCPDVTISNSLFDIYFFYIIVFLYYCLFVLLSFCLFVFLSFWLFVFLSFCLFGLFIDLLVFLSFCPEIKLIKCLKGLKSQKSLFVPGKLKIPSKLRDKNCDEKMILKNKKDEEKETDNKIIFDILDFSFYKWQQ